MKKIFLGFLLLLGMVTSEVFSMVRTREESRMIDPDDMEIGDVEKEELEAKRRSGFFDELIRFVRELPQDTNTSRMLFVLDIVQKTHDINSLVMVDGEWFSPLTAAIILKNRKLVSDLIQLGAAPNLIGLDARTHLIIASQIGDEIIVKLLLDASLDESTKVASPYKANIDTGDNNGDTALFFAAANGFVKIVALLLDYGASINAVDKLKRTPLFAAAASGYADVVKLLLDRGANRDNSHIIRHCGKGKIETPYEVAVKNGHEQVAKILLYYVSEYDKKQMQRLGFSIL